MRLPSDGHGPPGGGPGLPDPGGAARSRAPAINAPPVVLALIAILIAIQALVALGGDGVQQALVVYGAFWPGRFALATQGAFAGPANGLIAAASFVTYTFLHGGWTHAGVNALWLLAFGAPVARRLGTLRFLILYFLAGIAGAGLYLALHWGQMTPVLGASACVSGLTGALVRFGLRRTARRGDVGGPLSSVLDRNVLIFVIVWFGINVLAGLWDVATGAPSEAVAWEAHIGGFLVGLFGLRILDPRHPLDPLYRRLA